MKELDIEDLISKQSFLNYCSGSNPEDVALWEDWLKAHPEHRAEVEGLKLSILLLPLPVSEKVIGHDYQKLQLSIARLGKGKPARFKTGRIVTWAAAVVLLISGIYFFRHAERPEAVKPGLYVNDVAPGRQGATLTLSNGKQIRLNDAINGKLAQEAGVEITKDQNGQLVYAIKDQIEGSLSNTLSTGRGETYEVKLPDGTRVWLNSASSLTYAANLNQNGKRSVQLAGEGYFEVAKDKAHPFIVSTERQTVEVLGTHFNINSYTDESAIVTTLIEGSVKVSTAEQQQVIRPGEQALNSGQTLTVGKADLDKVTDWKDGDFNLDGLDFRIAMRKIARWYDVEVVYDEGVPQNLEAGGWISRNKPLSNVLSLIQSSGLVKFKIEGKKVYVSR